MTPPTRVSLCHENLMILKNNVWLIFVIIETWWFSFSPRVNVFLGENGQVRTNLLEAMYLISQGDSFRYGDNEP